MTVLMNILATLLILQITAGDEVATISTNKSSSWMNLTSSPKFREVPSECEELKVYICVLELHRNQVDLAVKMFRQFKNYENYDLLHSIIKQAYANNINNLFKLVNFITKLPWCNHQYVGFDFLVQVFKNSGHMYTQQSIQFAYQLKRLAESSPKCSHVNDDPRLVERFSNLRHSFPGGIKAIIWDSPKICIKNRLYNEELYAAGCCMFNKERRRVFTWIPRAQANGSEKKWTFEPIGDADSFRIKNTYYQEYLYASGDEYNKQRRYVFTWTPKNPVNQGYWQIEPIGVTDTYKLKNLYYNAYYYAAQCCQYDKNNRNIFTWTPKTELGNEGAWEFSAC